MLKILNGTNFVPVSVKNISVKKEPRNPLVVYRNKKQKKIKN